MYCTNCENYESVYDGYGVCKKYNEYVVKDYICEPVCKLQISSLYGKVVNTKEESCERAHSNLR